jgi:hypothetical protein
VQAFASSTQLVLGQVAVNEKPNEITAMPKLIELLDIKGRIVPALKGNQGTIHEDVKLFPDYKGGEVCCR